MNTPLVFHHDQEPLNFDYYSNQDCRVFKSEILNVDSDEVVQFKQISSYMKYQFHDYAMLCHSEKNSYNLSLYENSGYCGVYWWAHAAIARDWYRYAEYDLDLTVNFDKITHDFLIYNRAWAGTREYRLTLAEMIADQNLVNSCQTSFAPTDTDCHYTNHVFVNSSLKIKRTDLESIYTANTARSTDSANYNNQDYAACGIEVILETLFDDERLHLTEKTLRPIACGRPFILAGTAGSLEYLKSYGFETFSELIDESYDLVKNPLERLQAIVKEMRRIVALDTETKSQLWNKLYKIAERNKKRFFSNSWNNSIFQEYQDNFDIALRFMKQHRSGKRWRQVIEDCKKDPDLKQRIYYPQSGPWTTQDIEFVEEWLANPSD